jgi:hypothetical protein
MTSMMSVALPVLPGKVDRVRNIGQEIAGRQTEWNRLCREAGAFCHYNITLQESPNGDLCIYSMVLSEPEKVRMRFGDGEYDQWWLDFVRDVHGLDLSNGAAMPPSVFTWQA